MSNFLMTESKESVYKKEILPLISKIYEICEKEKIPMFSLFQYDLSEQVNGLARISNIEGNKTMRSLFSFLEKIGGLFHSNLIQQPTKQ